MDMDSISVSIHAAIGLDTSNLSSYNRCNRAPEKRFIVRSALLMITAVISAFLPIGAGAANAPPLVLLHRYDLPAEVKGHFDHFEVDPAGQRLFGTAVDDHLVVVFNFGTGKLIRLIQGADIPRGVIYRADLARLYVSDGGGALRIFDSRSYVLLNSLKLEVDADPIAFDPQTGRIFVVNGGEKAQHPFSHITVFDSSTGREVGNIQLDGIEIEGMTVEQDGNRLFANNRALNHINIFDRKTLQPLTIWPIKRAQGNTVAALDTQTHRLFVACNKGQLLVLNSDSGEELQVLPIGQRADSIAFDSASRRIFVSSGGGSGAVDVYREDDADHYNLLGRVATEPGAATSHLVASLNQYIVMAPASKQRPAQVLVYELAASE
jgi:DNA-binding beta-propeller fold protein YncE